LRATRRDKSTNTLHLKMQQGAIAFGALLVHCLCISGRLSFWTLGFLDLHQIESI
jgi:hypothetical protein